MYNFTNSEIRFFSIRLIVLALILASCQTVKSQNYEVSKAKISLDQYDDYSPVYFRDGLVFCSTRKTELKPEQATADQIEDANIWFVSMADSTDQGSAPILWEELRTPFFDGPATFGPGGNEIY